MKKVFTLIFALTTFASTAFAQCEDITLAKITGNASRLFLTFSDATAADDFYVAQGGVLGVSTPVPQMTVNPGDPPGADVTGDLVETSSDIKLRITLDMDHVLGNYTGTITTAGGVCTFSAGALPVSFTSFAAKKMTKAILLGWETASEINNEGFVIERGHRTAYGMEWNRLGFIDGNGTTQALQAYSFIDQNPVEGVNYYRLKQMDYDGKYEYSSVVAVEYSRKNGGISIGIFPNPAKDQLTLTNGEGKATIYNTLGQPVKHLTIDANQATIQLANLLNGQYYLQVLQEDGIIVTKQFAKVN